MVDVATRLKPVEGTALLSDFLEVTHSPIDASVLIDGLAKLATDLDAASGARVRSAAARILIEQLHRSPPYNWHPLLETFPVVAEKMEHAERLRLYEEAASVVAHARERSYGFLLEMAEEWLAQIVAKLPRDEAVHICGPVVAPLTKALGVETEPLALARLANAWAPLAKFDVSADAQRIPTEVVPKLVQVVTTTKWESKNDHELTEIVTAIAQLAARLDHREASSVAKDIARVLMGLDDRTWRGNNGHMYQQVGATLATLATLMETGDAVPLLMEWRRRDAPDLLILGPWHDLDTVFVEAARRMDPAQRARLCGAVVKGILVRLAATDDAYALQDFADALVQIAPQADVDEVGPACADAANLLIKKMRATPAGDEGRLQSLASAVLAICSILSPSQRARACGEAARAMLAVGAQPAHFTLLMKQMESREVAELVRMAVESREAAELVRMAVDKEFHAVIASLRAETWYDVNSLVNYLELCDSRTASEIVWLLAQIICSNAYAAIDWEEFDLLLSAPSAETGDGDPSPRGCRLTTPQLVELLKMPTCFGKARQVILGHLGRRYDRRFNTVWAFVRFAEAEKLGLDFTAPPVRPDPAKMEVPTP